MRLMQLNLEQMKELSQDLLVAINKFYDLDPILGHNNDRVRLVNKLIAHRQKLERHIHHSEKI
jgi:phosphopentomutase